MGRKMTKAPTHAWRAVVTIRIRHSGDETTEYLGPYWRKSDATARVTLLRNSYAPERSYREFVSGHIESAPLGEWSVATCPDLTACATRSEADSAPSALGGARESQA